MVTSILNSTEALTLTNAIICTVVALILGLMISFTYMASKEYSKNFVITLVLLPLLVGIVIIMVNGNLGTGVAVMGAFSLVRFRSVPGSSKEISFIFFTMAAGLAVGTGYIVFAFGTTLIICSVFLLLSKSSFGEINKYVRNLKITIPENLDYTYIFDEIFAKYTKKAELVKVKTTNLGSMFELQYSIIFKNINEEKMFLDDIRCRNGNLTIICSRNISNKDEL